MGQNLAGLAPEPDHVGGKPVALRVLGPGGVFNTISDVLCTAHLVGRVAPNLQYVGVTEHDIPSTSHFGVFPASLEVFLSSIVTSKTFALLFLGALELDPELVLILSDCV